MVHRLKDVLISLLEKLIGVMFIAITAVTAAQVFCRYVLSFSLSWSHELSVLLLIWISWLCVPIGLDRGQHLSVTLILDNVSPKAQKRLQWVHWLLSLFFLILAFFLTFPVIEAFEGMRLLTLPIPTGARYWAASVGSLLSVLVLAARLFPERAGQ
ncbi:MAG: TRAP transporter small permease subunit [Proteobacteria bacterium]|nr:TRAP transporter small permease subunit [Pseudomonadota bacterium]